MNIIKNILLAAVGSDGFALLTWQVSASVTKHRYAAVVILCGTGLERRVDSC